MRFAALLISCTLLFTGCAYRLGPTNGLVAGERSIQFNPPLNSTLEPRIGEALSHALRKQIQHDGTYRLDTRSDGDIVVSTTITGYDRQGLTFEPLDTLTVRDYGVRLHAHVVAFDRIAGKNVVDRDFNGHTTVRVGRDQASAERQALPLLAEDLARNITAALVDGAW